MIGCEQELPQVRLAGSVRYRLFELNSRVSRHCLERFAIDLEFSETRRPRGGRWRLGAPGPVVVRPFHFLIRRIPAEIEDIVLSDSEMFDQLPRRVWQSGGLDPAKTRLQALDGGIEGNVSILPRKESSHVLTTGLLVGHVVIHFLRARHGSDQ